MVRAGLTAEKVVEAAAGMADEAGIDGVTVSALARRLGVKDASLYKHVRNLRDLKVRVALSGSEEMADRIGTAVAGRAGRDALVAFADAYRDYALAYPGRYAATQMQFDLHEVVDSVGLRRCVELTYGMLRGYDLTDPDLTDAARLLRSTFHGYVHLELSGGFGDRRPVRVSWSHGLDALHLMLMNWPTRGDGTV